MMTDDEFGDPDARFRELRSRLEPNGDLHCAIVDPYLAELVACAKEGNMDSLSACPGDPYERKSFEKNAAAQRAGAHRAMASALAKMDPEQATPTKQVLREMAGALVDIQQDLEPTPAARGESVPEGPSVAASPGSLTSKSLFSTSTSELLKPRQHVESV